MNQEHKEGKYTNAEIKKWLNSEKVINQAYAELLTFILNDNTGSKVCFTTAYKKFRNNLFDVIINSTSKKDIVSKLAPPIWIHYIMTILPQVENRESFIYHNELQNVEYSASNGYNSYRNEMDVAEVYAAYLIYSYCEIELINENKHSEELDCYEKYAGNIKKNLRSMILNAAPFTGPKLNLFAVASSSDKYLDEGLEDARCEDIEVKFRLACGKKDTRMMYKLLGELRHIDPEGIDYYEGYADYSDNQFEDAIHYLLKVKNDSKYYKMAKPLLVECNAMLGREEEFMKLVNLRDGVPISFDYISYSTILLIKNAVKTSPRIYSRILESYFTDEPDWSYRSLVRRDGYMAMIEGVNLLQEFDTYKEINNKAIFDSKQIAVLEKCNKIIHFLLRGQDFFYTKHNKNALTYGESVEQIEGGVMIAIRDKYMGHDDVLPTCPNITLEDQLFFFESIYKLGLYKAFHKQVGHHLDWFKSIAKLDKPMAILKNAYIEGLALSDANQNLMEYVSANIIRDETDLIDKTMNSKMRVALSSRCYKAYEAAEWQYQKSAEDDYGWKDAGMIALSFFRIVEMTINEKLIQPMAGQVMGEPRNILHTEREKMSAKDRAIYNEKWGKIVNTLFEISKNQDKGMMLGDLEKMFINIGSSYDINDKIAVLIKNSVSGLLTETGRQKILVKYYLEDALSQEKRSKFRNPPAHCRYLTYDVACECREFTCNLLFILNSLIKT